MKGKAFLLVLLLFVSLLAAIPMASPEAGEHRDPGVEVVKLYVQLSAVDEGLSTEQSSAANRPFITSQIDFPSVELEESLKVMGVETEFDLNKGFSVTVGVAAGIRSARTTMQVREDDDVVANRTLTIPAGETRWDWPLPFQNDKDSHTFSRDSVITLRIISADGVAIRVQTHSNSFIELRCVDHLDIDVETRDADDKRTSSFFPNDLLESRNVIVQGDVTNPFGEGDIDEVNVTIRRPNGQTVVNEDAAALSGLSYSYNWTYATGLPAGRYTINVTGTDLQNHPFSATGSFFMEEYGIRLSAEGEESGKVEKSTTPGTPARYTLTVLNIGGRTASVEMDEGAAVSLWLTSFSKSTLSLDAGDDQDVTFDVKPSSILKGGNQSRYIVTCTVTNDPSVPKAHDSIEVLTFVRDEVRFQITPENPAPKTVGVGGSVDHTFSLRNLGEQSTTVDLIKSSAPTGWTTELRVSGEISNVVRDLGSMDVVDITLRVAAPTSSVQKKASITVKCRSRDFPTVEEEVTFETKMVIGLTLKANPPLTFTQDPESSFSVYFQAWNPDPQRSHNITFEVEQDTTDWTALDAFEFVPQSPVMLNSDPTGASPTAMELKVTIPSDAEADENIRFTIKGKVDGNKDVFQSFRFNLTINVNHRVSFAMDPPDARKTVNTQEYTYVFFRLENQGNVVEEVNITVDYDDDLFKITIDDAETSILLKLPLEPGYSGQIKIGFKARKDARHKTEETIGVSLTSAKNPDLDQGTDFQLVVEKNTAEIFGEILFPIIVPGLMVLAVAVIVVMKPKRRGYLPPEEKGEDDKEADHGAVGRV
jgi:uncharacterized membrane protein